MEKYSPENLRNLGDVVSYWERCLSKLKLGEDDTVIASQMVDVVNNIHDNEWSDSNNEYYSEIFELVASLELPGGDEKERAQDWKRVEELLQQMRRNID